MRHEWNTPDTIVNIFLANGSSFPSFSSPCFSYVPPKPVLEATLSPGSGTHGAVSPPGWGLMSACQGKGRTCALTGAGPRLPTLCVRHFRRERPGRLGRECGSVPCARGATTRPAADWIKARPSGWAGECPRAQPRGTGERDLEREG